MDCIWIDLTPHSLSMLVRCLTFCLDEGELLGMTDYSDWYVPGWYVVCASHRLKCEQVRSFSVCGKDLVVFRTSSGTVAAVEKDCASRSYPVYEQYGMIWFFAGETPYEQLPSEAHLFPRDTWRRVGSGDIGEIDTDCRDIMENAVDWAHFRPVHHIEVCKPEFLEIKPTRLRVRVDIRAAFDNIFWDGKIARLLKQVGLNAYFTGTLHLTLYGPSLLYVDIDLHSRFYPPLRFITMLSPLAPQKTKQFYAAYASVGLRNPFALLVARLFARKLRIDLLADKRMWKDKLPSDHAVLCDTERLSIAIYRDWWAKLAQAGQFPQ